MKFIFVFLFLFVKCETMLVNPSCSGWSEKGLRFCTAPAGTMEIKLEFVDPKSLQICPENIVCLSTNAKATDMLTSVEFQLTDGSNEKFEEVCSWLNSEETPIDYCYHFPSSVDSGRNSSNATHNTKPTSSITFRFSDSPNKILLSSIDSELDVICSDFTFSIGPPKSDTVCRNVEKHGGNIFPCALLEHMQFVVSSLKRTFTKEAEIDAFHASSLERDVLSQTFHQLPTPIVVDSLVGIAKIHLPPLSSTLRMVIAHNEITDGYEKYSFNDLPADILLRFSSSHTFLIITICPTARRDEPSLDEFKKLPFNTDTKEITSVDIEVSRLIPVFAKHWLDPNPLKGHMKISDFSFNIPLTLYCLLISSDNIPSNSSLDIIMKAKTGVYFTPLLAAPPRKRETTWSVVDYTLTVIEILLVSACIGLLSLGLILIGRHYYQDNLTRLYYNSTRQGFLERLKQTFLIFISKFRKSNGDEEELEITQLLQPAYSPLESIQFEKSISTANGSFENEYDPEFTEDQNSWGPSPNSKGKNVKFGAKKHGKYDVDYQITSTIEE